MKAKMDESLALEMPDFRLDDRGLMTNTLQVSRYVCALSRDLCVRFSERRAKSSYCCVTEKERKKKRKEGIDGGNRGAEREKMPWANL